MRKSKLRMLPKMIRMTKTRRRKRRKGLMIRIQTKMIRRNKLIKNQSRTINQNRRVTKSQARMRTR